MASGGIAGGGATVGRTTSCSPAGGTAGGGTRSVGERYDIVVCGGGLAGLCAAIAAARHGARVCLVQDRPVLGGTSSSEIRVPPQGAASFHAYARETGIVSELLIEERARNHEEPGFDNGYINSVWDLVLYDAVMRTPNLTLRLNATVTAVRMRDGDDAGRPAAESGDTAAGSGEAGQPTSGEATIEAVVARVAHAETELTLYADTFVDCTGDGFVAAMAGCEWRLGTESRVEFGEPHAPEQASDAVMGSSLHFKARNVGYPVPFTAPDWAVRYDNPDFFYKAGRWPGDPRNGFWWIELSVPWHTIYDNETLRHELTRHVLGIWDWIKNRDPRLKDEAATYALDWIGQVPGKRESRRIMGDYLMTEHDPLNRTVFADEVAYGGWFVDLHEPGGLLAPFSEKAAVEAHDPNGTYMARSYVGPYGIPLRILLARGVDNLMMAGRNVSVTHAALGTVRVMGTTALMGQAAGTAAALASRAGKPLRGVPAAAVQQALLRDGCFLPNAANEDPRDLARAATVRASSEAALSGGEPDPREPDEGGPQAGPLVRRRGQWIAVGADRIERLAVCLDNGTDTAQRVEARLYAVDHIWDYRVEPGEPLATTLLEVAPGLRRWAGWAAALDVSPLRGRYVRLDLLANPHVCWHEAAAVEPGHASAYDMGNGQMRRYGNGRTMSFRIEPAQLVYGAAAVLSGVTRPYRSPNLWRSDPAQPLPQWLELAWERPVAIGRVELTCAGSLLRDYRQYPALYRDPQCARDIAAEAFVDGRWMPVGAIFGNYQRRAAIVPEAPVRTDRLRVTVFATNGDPSAALYEVRCYPD
ncbi:FAD-dependent oxidoreductase [Paenibacillus cymbidii]|uniref:FAD-dependent oxidoreductase n=1 Tax=Paenibacillus cymbidii TaxID=1639034 RepID=UPI001080340C|nr:FAD-dependent oxidoreductase [Paenibacillus cymbidii]